MIVLSAPRCSRPLMPALALAVLMAACGGSVAAPSSTSSPTTTGTEAIPPSVPPTAATTTTATTTTMATTTTTTTTTTLPPPEVDWGEAQELAVLGHGMFARQGDVDGIVPEVFMSWGESVYLFASTDIRGRSHDVGVLFTDMYADVWVWSSPDGLTWARERDLPLPGFFDEWVYAACHHGDDLVVAGSFRPSGSKPRQVGSIWVFPTEDRDAAVWLGSGDPPAWVRAESGDLIDRHEQEIRDVVSLGGILVAVGGSHYLPEFGTMAMPEYDGVVWISEDGTEWARVDDAGGVFSGSGVITNFTAAVTDGATVWVFGAEDRGSSAAFGVWTSADGIAWSRVKTEGTGLGSSDGIRIADAAWSPGSGTVVVGNRSSGTTRSAAIWFSPDGVAWEVVDPGIEGDLTGLVATTAGFVAAGFAREDGRLEPLVLVSADGRNWHRDRSERFDIPGGVQGAITAIGTHGDLVVIAATVRYVDDNRRVLVWTGRLGPGTVPG